MPRLFRLAGAMLVAAFAASGPASAEMRGHGGPVRAVAVSPDGGRLVSGSFDTTVIHWSLDRGVAEEVLRVHDGAVNAAVWLKDGRFATAGEDGRIAIWQAGEAKPRALLEGHMGPVMSLAVSPDGATLASASWDRTARLWRLADGTSRALEGHRDNVNGVAFTADGRFVATAGYDAAVRLWPVAGGEPFVAIVGSALNAVAVAADGEIVVAGADGRVRFLSREGETLAEIEATPTPVIALALSADGSTVAAAGLRGSVTVIDRARRAVAATLVGPGLPVWSVAFTPDGREIVTGGTDRMVRRWNARTGEPIGVAVATAALDPAADPNDHGARVFRACVACHTLTPEDGNRAGPTLHGIFGRRIATQPGYNFSPALRNMDIVWTPETVARLFEIGPTAFTPGTKMPEQVIRNAEDRAALIRFLERTTRPRG